MFSLFFHRDIVIIFVRGAFFHSLTIDLSGLPSNVLRGLATIEADVSSHAEAVLHGRLSKITQEKINLEQQIQTETGNPQPLEQEAAQLDTCPKEVERSSNGRQMISDLRRKLRKAIR